MVAEMINIQNNNTKNSFLKSVGLNNGLPERMVIAFFC